MQIKLALNGQQTYKKTAFRSMEDRVTNLTRLKRGLNH